MANKAKHAFGNSNSIEAAKAANKIDAFDILFLDGDTEPKVGWLDKNGEICIAEGKTQIVRVTELPTENGDENVVYIYNNEGYIWNGTQCVSLAKSADLSALEAEIATKVDEAKVLEMIETYGGSESEIVEF